MTEWLRLGIAPLAAAARMELRHPAGDTAAVAALDVEASFLLYALHKTLFDQSFFA